MDYKARVANAVNDEEWQKLRHSLKGKTTETKLDELELYWLRTHDEIRLEAGVSHRRNAINLISCNVCIRVDNYIKSLCRGGQLNQGESLQSVIDQRWLPPIRK